MHLPQMTLPATRNRHREISDYSRTIVPAFSLCGTCDSIVKTVVGKAGCGWLGLLEFEAECNAALDVETEGFGAIVCAAAGAALKEACDKGISNIADYVANAACSKIPGCSS